MGPRSDVTPAAVSEIPWKLGSVRQDRGRLVQVDPDAIHAVVEKRAGPPAPPGARLGPREVGKRRIARPRPLVMLAAFGVDEKMPLCNAFLVHRVARLGFDRRIQNPDRAEAEVVEIVVGGGGIGEALRIEGEDLVGVHVVDVDPNGVARHLAFAKLASELANARVRVV